MFIKNSAKKHVIFEEINLISVPVIFFQKLILRSECHSLHYKLPTYLLNLSKIVNPLNYENHSTDKNEFYFDQIRCQLIDNLHTELKNLKIFKILESHFCSTIKQRKIFEVAVKSIFEKELIDVTHLILYSKAIGIAPESITLVLKSNWLASACQKSFKYRILRSWFKIPSLKPFWLALKRQLFEKNEITRQIINDSTAPSFIHDKTLDKYSIAYIPHKGIYYGNLFLKDHFYSNNQNSLLAAQKILHLSCGEHYSEYLDTIIYYNNNKIPYSDINFLSRQTLKQSVLSFLSIVSMQVLITSLFQNKSIWKIKTFFTLFHSIKKRLSALEQIPNLKHIFYGYEILVHPSLAFAINLRGIKTYATQERFIVAFGKLNPTIVDYFFTHGEVVNDFLKKENRDFNVIENLISIGPIRGELIRNADISQENKYSHIKKSKFLMLVLDYHPSISFDENRIQYNNNWKTNKRFYNDIILLATEFKQIHFCIKGKNTDVLNHPEFKEIVEKIRQMDNLEFETNLDYYTPSRISKLCDGCIALHTSLGDELLMNRKPVIFHDLLGIPSAYFKYEPLSIISYDYQELKAKTQAMLYKTLIHEKDFKYIQKQFYSVEEKSAKEKLHQYLDQFICSF